MTKDPVELPLFAEKLFIRLKSIEFVGMCLRHFAPLMGGLLDVGQLFKQRPDASSEPAMKGPQAADMLSI